MRPNSPAKPLMPSQNIETLTSLRFIAAAMIVIHHMSGHFGLSNFSHGLGLGQGVSFFFVLSGFILTWVYGRGERTPYTTFLHHRFFRIYPLHMLTFVASILLIETTRNELSTQPLAALLQVGMLQSWTGEIATAFTFNAPAWSISTEFGFYLVFPLLLTLGSRVWIAFLGIVVATIAAMAFAVSHPDAEASTRIWEGLHVSPVGRLIEFVFGMLLARAVIDGRFRWLRPSTVAFTFYEVLAVASVSIFVLFQAEISRAVNQLIPSSGLVGWMNHSSGFVAFGLLILFFSFERGVLSRLLRHPSLVFLGEASFALYLFHQPVIRYFREHGSLLAWMSPLAVMATVILTSLCLASLSFLLVETPIRVAARKGLGGGLDRLRLAVHSPALKAVAAGLGIIALALPAGSLIGIRTVSEHFAQLNRAEGTLIDQGYVNNDIQLVSAKVRQDDHAYCYTFLWRIKPGGEVNGTIRALHFVSRDGDIKSMSHHTLVSRSARPRQQWRHVRDDYCLNRNLLIAVGPEAKLRVLLIDDATRKVIPRITQDPSPDKLYVELSALTASPEIDYASPRQQGTQTATHSL